MRAGRRRRRRRKDRRRTCRSPRRGGEGAPPRPGPGRHQLARAGMDATKVAPFARVARVGVVSSWLAGGAQDTPRGYFKLEKWIVPREVEPMTDDSDDSDDDSDDDSNARRVLIVAFGSAPGVPNWGGLLKKLRDDVRARGANNVGARARRGRRRGRRARRFRRAVRRGHRSLVVRWVRVRDGAGETAERRWRARSRRSRAGTEEWYTSGTPWARPRRCCSPTSRTFLWRSARRSTWCRQASDRALRAVDAPVRRRDDRRREARRPRGPKVVVHTGSWAHDVDQAAAVLRGLGSDDLTAFEDARTGAR